MISEIQDFRIEENLANDIKAEAGSTKFIIEQTIAQTWRWRQNFSLRQATGTTSVLFCLVQGQ